MDNLLTWVCISWIQFFICNFFVSSKNFHFSLLFVPFVLGELKPFTLGSYVIWISLRGTKYFLAGWRSTNIFLGGLEWVINSNVGLKFYVRTNVFLHGWTFFVVFWNIWRCLFQGVFFLRLSPDFFLLNISFLETNNGCILLVQVFWIVFYPYLCY